MMMKIILFVILLYTPLYYGSEQRTPSPVNPYANIYSLVSDNEVTKDESFTYLSSTTTKTTETTVRSSIRRRLFPTLTTPSYNCERPLDIIFCLDGSGSVTAEKWPVVLNFVRDVVSSFDIGSGPTQVQVGVIEFSTSAGVEIALDEYQNVTALMERILTIAYYTGSTNTAEGIIKSQADIVTYGRPSNEGGAHLIIVVTDGQSDNTDATIAAANAARAGRSTVACITIGPSSAFKPGEVEGIVGGDMRLAFPIENWDGIEQDGAIVQNITQLACSVPIIIDNLEEVSSTLPCNSSLFLVYFPNVTTPITLVANISSGSIIICYSYLNSEPSPTDISGLSSCSIVGLGETQIGTTTAYPVTNSSDPSFQETLYVSVSSTKIEVNVNETCGGNFTLQAYYCSTEIATNITHISGNSGSLSNSSIIVNTTIIGDPSAPRCSECPKGTAFLSTDPLSSLYRICSSSCAATEQFTDIDPNTGLQTCRNCDNTCNTCVAPGGPRSCTSCPNGYTLLPNDIDPSLNNPYWSTFTTGTYASGVINTNGVKILPDVTQLGSLKGGRCVPQCPPGYARNNTNVTTIQEGFTVNTDICSGENNNVANSNSSSTPLVLATFCLPLNPGTPSPSISCKDYAPGGTTGGATPYLPGTLALALGVPPASIFLRACVDTQTSTRWVWTYGSPYSVNAINTTAYAYQSNLALGTCNCSYVLTYAYFPTIAKPLDSSSDFLRAIALSNISNNVNILQQRSNEAIQSLQQQIRTLKFITPGRSPSTVAPNCSTSADYTNYNAPILIGLCSDDSTSAALAPTPERSQQLDGLTMCYYVPFNPEPIPYTSPYIVPVAAVVVPFFLMLFCCSGACLFYYRWRQKRIRLIQFHARRSVSFASINTFSADGLPKSRDTIASYVPTELGSNPYATAINPFDPLDRSGGKLTSNARIRTAFEPTRSKSMKNLNNTNITPNPEVPMNTEVEMRAVTEESSTTQPPAIELPSEPEPKETPVESTDVQVTVNPLESVIEPVPESVIEPLPNDTDNTGTIVITSPLDFIADYGASSPSAARTPTKSMSISQQVIEFLAPGSVTLGMGIFNDTIPEPALPTPISPPSSGYNRSDRVRNAMRNANSAPIDLGPATFNVDVVRTKREVVQTQTVRLRRVDEIKGDSEWAASKRTLTVNHSDEPNGSNNGSNGDTSASPWSFTAVVKKEVVVEERKVGAVTVKRF